MVGMGKTKPSRVKNYGGSQESIRYEMPTNIQIETGKPRKR